jgi:hypothetical protein
MVTSCGHAVRRDGAIARGPGRWAPKVRQTAGIGNLTRGTFRARSPSRPKHFRELPGTVFTVVNENVTGFELWTLRERAAPEPSSSLGRRSRS